ncbi:hypothetical protein BS47DRAFT_1335822, partial [Hydnum rufescens UP504]
MPPRKSKAKKNVDPRPRRSTRSAQAAEIAAVKADTTPSIAAHDVPPTVPPEAGQAPGTIGGSLTKDALSPVDRDADVQMDTGTSPGITTAPESEKPGSGLTFEQRQSKLDELRLKMRNTAQANRADLIEEHQRQKTTARDLARLEKQRHLAAILREKAEAEEKGLDSERKKNWNYSIEENDLWEKRMKRKVGRADFQFHDAADAARKKYKKDLDQLKPDLAAYTRQKEAALGLVPGALARVSSPKDIAGIVSASSSSSVAQRLASEDLYRDANTLQYGDNKPSEDAIDRVVNKLNNECAIRLIVATCRVIFQRSP